MQVTYKYNIDDVVVTPFGKEGIVRMLGYDDGGVQYYVNTADGGAWYKEKVLSQDPPLASSE